MQDLLDVLVCVRLHADTFSWEIGGNHLTRGSWICFYLLVGVGKLLAKICLLFTICCIANQDALTAIADKNVCRQ